MLEFCFLIEIGVILSLLLLLQQQEVLVIGHIRASCLPSRRSDANLLMDSTPPATTKDNNIPQSTTIHNLLVGIFSLPPSCLLLSMHKEDGAELFDDNNLVMVLRYDKAIAAQRASSSNVPIVGSWTILGDRFLNSNTKHNSS